MFSTTLLCACFLLQVGNENPIPGGERQRQPAPTQSQLAPTTVTSPPVTSPPPTRPDQLYITSSLLKLPDYHQIPVAATERALLMSLKTEQRDAAGNIVTDEEGNPVIVPVRRGMKVFAGQVLGNFDDRELHAMLKINQAQLEVAKSEHEKEIEVIFAAQGVLVARFELYSMQDGNKRVPGTFPEIEVKKAELAYEQALANLELQKYNIEEVKAKEVVVRENELERTKVLIDIRKIFAPIDGIVVDIKAAEGQWLREGDPVLEIVQLDTLWAQVHVDARRYTHSDIDGKPATIQAVLANGKVETFQGKVVYCDPNIESNRQFIAFIEIQNRRVGDYWMLQPGYCDFQIVIQL